MTRVLTTFAIGALSLSMTALGFQQRPGGQGAGQGVQLQGPNAIVGRVTAAGKPMSDVFVTALRPSESIERPFSFVSARLHVLTDANGAYRLDSLAIDNYFVIAIPHNPPGTPQQPTRSGYGRTFFPAASEVQQAGRVRVDGHEPARADIALASARLSIVSGQVIGSNGQPVTGGVLGVAHGDHLFGLDSPGYRLSPSGAFTIPPCPPGTYFLVFHESAWPPAKGEIPAVSQVKVVVNGTDVTGVRVVPIHMVQASGRLVVNSGGPTSNELLTMTVGASPIDFDGNPGPQRPGAVLPNLTFTFKTWPGDGRVRVSPEAAWAIKSVRLNGVDVTGKPLAFVEGRDVAGLEVEVTRRPLGRGGS